MKCGILALLLVPLFIFLSSCTQPQGTTIYKAVQGEETPVVCEELEFEGLQIAHAATHEAIYLKWNPATGSCDQFFYQIYMSVFGGIQNKMIMETSDTSVYITGLNSGVMHTFKVVAKDMNQVERGKYVTKSAVTLNYPTLKFYGLTDVVSFRPSAGEYESQNSAQLVWPNVYPDHYRIYRAPTEGGHNFDIACENTCKIWSQIPPTCCRVPGSQTNFTFVGLDANQENHFVVRAVASNGVSDKNIYEKVITTAGIPSGMKEVHYAFVDKNGTKYKLFVDMYEGACGSDYDPATQICNGEVADPPRAGLPPMSLIQAEKARLYCEGVPVRGYGFGHTKRLLTLKEYYTASSWVDNPFNLGLFGNQAFYKIETAGELDDSNCNTYGYRKNSEKEGTGSYVMVTGHPKNKNCKSYIGARDMVGNVREYIQDTMHCDMTEDYVSVTCLGNPNGIDDALVSWGYCTDRDNNGSCDNKPEIKCGPGTGVYRIKTEGISPPNELIPNRADSDFLISLVEAGLLGPNAQLDAMFAPIEGFNNDLIVFSFDQGDVYPAVGGHRGGWAQSDGREGRFSMVSGHTGLDSVPDTGFRCAFAVPINK